MSSILPNAGKVASALLEKVDKKGQPMTSYQLTTDIPEAIFRAYDIRSDSALLTDDVVYTIAHAYANQLKQRQQNKCILGRDGRLSSPRIFAAFSRGLLDSGVDVVDLGIITTPLLYFAGATGDVTSGVMISASHNPKAHNGFKMIFDNVSPTAKTIKDLYHLTQAGEFEKGQGVLSQREIIPGYIEHITSSVSFERSLKIIIDCSNGVSGVIAPELFSAMNGQYIFINETVDGNFPSHKPDTSVPEEYQQLQAAVTQHQADIGIMFDGDADRVGVVCNDGNIIWPDRLLMLLAQDILQKYPGGTIVYDVKSTQNLKKVIEDSGGKPIMWRTGHSIMKRKIHDEQAPVGAELSGHVFFNDRWFGFDDGVYTAVRLLEVIAKQSKSVSEIFAALPDSISTPEILYPVSEDEKFDIITRLQQASFPDSLDVNQIDGVRVTFEKGWALVRASNTSPNLTLRFEAQTKEALEAIQHVVLRTLKEVEA